jgi:hypothetical protein
MAKALFGIAQSEEQAIRIANDLRVAGFSDDAISVLCPDKQGTRDFAHEQHTKAPEGAVSGVATAGIIGGALGWLVGIGTLAIPGVGPLIAAGPILAALSGVAAGGAREGSLLQARLQIARWLELIFAKPVEAVVPDCQPWARLWHGFSPTL